jgi:N-acetylglucosamine-6-phosphate deacetylase
MYKALTNGKIYTGDGIITGKAILIKDGLITGIIDADTIPSGMKRRIAVNKILLPD